jgi:hypothetical protein
MKQDEVEKLKKCLEIQLFRFNELLWVIGEDEPIMKKIKSHNIPMIERVLSGGEIMPNTDIEGFGQ